MAVASYVVDVGGGVPHLREDDNAAINTAVFGLIGEGAGVEFLEWRRSADLPDPVAVVENPDSAFDWQSRSDLVWAVLSGVTAWAVGRGTVEAWRSAWGPLIAAAEAGAPDVAGARRARWRRRDRRRRLSRRLHVGSRRC